MNTENTRGSIYVRLDWAPLHFGLHPWGHAELPKGLQDVIAGTPWVVERQIRHKRSRHVNVQETVAAVMVVEDACKNSLEPERLVNGTDSRVALGAIAKGRSSSSALNGCLRRLMGLCVFGNKFFVQFWIPSELNPSDDPSRDKQLRAPKSMPAELAHLICPERTPHRYNRVGSRSSEWVFREAYSGMGRLSKCMRQEGFGVLTPMEAYPKHGSVRYVSMHDLDRPDVFASLLESIVKGKSSICISGSLAPVGLHFACSVAAPGVSIAR